MKSAGPDFIGVPPPATLWRLYWTMRFSMAGVWLWTAYVSWYVFPHSISIAWLRRCGIARHGDWVLMSSCALDLAMGLAACGLARRWLWQGQFVLVAAYSLVICIALPEFLVHPFGAITKNSAVLACLAYLSAMEKYRHTS